MCKLKSIIKTIFCNIGLYVIIVGFLAIANNYFRIDYSEQLKLRYRYTKYKNNVVEIPDYFKKVISETCRDGYTMGWAILEKSTKTYYFEDVRMILDRNLSQPKIEDRFSDAIEKKDYKEIYIPNIAKYNPYFSKQSHHSLNNITLNLLKNIDNKTDQKAFYCDQVNNCSKSKNIQEDKMINTVFAKYKGNLFYDAIVNSNHPISSISLIIITDKNVHDVNHIFWIAKMQHYKYITNKCDGEIGKNILEKMVKEIH